MAEAGVLLPAYRVPAATLNRDMSDDLFSKLFELFNAPGPVNLKLAAEVAHHLVGERQPVDPWAAEELRDLTRLAEQHIAEVAPFPVPTAPDVLPVDAREWTDRNLEGFRLLAEPMSQVLDADALAGLTGGAPMLSALGPALIGMQVGTLAGSLGRWVMAGFDAGLPISVDGPVTFVVPTIDRFASGNGFDPRDVRLWVALNESTHRAMFRVSFTMDEVTARLASFGAAVQITPDKLEGLMSSFDPQALSADPAQLGSLFATPELENAQRRIAGFLGLTAAYRRLLVERAAGSLLPRLDEMERARDVERDLGDEAESSPLAAVFIDREDIERGRRFCDEVERRFGAEALASIWTRPGRLPESAELEDPVAWAARVLLEDLD